MERKHNEENKYSSSTLNKSSLSPPQTFLLKLLSPSLHRLPAMEK